MVMLAPFMGLPIPNPILPVLGVLFLPTTTLGVSFAQASFGGVSSFSVPKAEKLSCPPAHQLWMIAPEAAPATEEG